MPARSSPRPPRWPRACRPRRCSATSTRSPARLTAIVEHADASAAEDGPRRDEHRAAQTARKEALAAEAEEIATDSTQWKSAGDRLREILDEWRTITGLDRKTDDALWKRYSAARETFNRRRGSHFAELDRERVGARQAKEALCERAEELADSTDWGPTGATFRDLLTEWKAAGRAAKDVDDALWARFKAAQDKFFAARNATNAERDAEFGANADAKEALLAQAEAIDVSDPEAARSALRAIGDKWDAIGKVPRERGAELERRLRAVEKKVRDAATTSWTPIRRPRPGPTSSAFAPSSTSIRPRRPRRPAAPRMPSRPGPAPRSGGNGPRRRSRRSARSARRRSRRSGRAGVVEQPLALPLGDDLRRSSSAASCTAVRDHTTRAQWKVSRITAIHATIRPMPGPGCGRGDGLTRPDRQHAERAGHRRAGQGDPGQPPAPGEQGQHREADAEHQDQPGEHPRRQGDRGLAMAASSPTRTSSPLAPPVCGSTNVSRRTKTRIATTRARAPGRFRVRRAVRHPRCRP